MKSAALRLVTKVAYLFLIFAASDSIVKASDSPKTNHDKEWEKIARHAIDSIKQRNPRKELVAAIKHGKVSFYSIGSYMYGYRLPGLSETEVRDVESAGYPIINEFPDDPSPFWASKEYWEEAEQFTSVFNRLVFDYYEKISKTRSKS